MSITIFASGKIARIENIATLIDDLKKVAEKSGWQYRIIDDGFATQPNAVLTRSDPGPASAKIEGSLGLKGIILTIEPGVERLPILFDRSGVLTDMMQQLSWISDRQNERFTSCKTQFGSIDSHIRIIEVFDLLKKKYMADLAVTDEGDYWQCRDPRILAEKRIRLGQCMRHVESVIKSIEMTGNDTRDEESIASRIEEALLKTEKDNGLHQ